MAPVVASFLVNDGVKVVREQGAERLVGRLIFQLQAVY